VLVARNDLEGALKHYREGLDIRRALYEQDKSHAERARDVSVSVNRIGDVLVARNDLEGALKHYREGLDISRALYEQDKSHAERARDVAVSLSKTATVAQQQGEKAEACANYREGLDIVERLAAAAPDVHQLKGDADFFRIRMKEAGC
jgi:tetratricopeptide (TPR) repeat protein